MDVALLVGGIGVAAAVLFLLVPAITLRAVAGRLEPRIAAAVPPERVVLRDLRANSLGVQSKGGAQARGNGALVLTPDALWFFQAVPRRDLTIPLDAVTGVATARSHLGKTYFRDLLKVSYRTEGGDDSVAWYVTDLAAWKAKLADLVPRP